MSKNNKTFTPISIRMLLGNIPLTLFLMQRKQKTQNHADASTTISFNPNSASNEPIMKNIGDPISIDIMTEPPQTTPIAGDIKKDNLLNILDHNILPDRGYGAINPLQLDNPNTIYNHNYSKAHEPFKSNSNLDDNRIINSPDDYNLFIRELSVQNGD